MSKTSCILVGNGTTLLDAVRGTDIDAHECVVRFNSFTLDRFIPHTGSRCNVWFTVQTAAANSFRMNLPWEKVWCHSWEPKLEKCRVFQSHRLHHKGDDLAKVNHKILTDISEYIKTDFIYWSTGLLAIWIMLQERDSVTITGFDWWDKADHHYNDKAPRGTLHRPELEHECIKKLAADGKLHFL